MENERVVDLLRRYPKGFWVKPDGTVVGLESNKLTQHSELTWDIEGGTPGQIADHLSRRIVMTGAEMGLIHAYDIVTSRSHHAISYFQTLMDIRLLSWARITWQVRDRNFGNGEGVQNGVLPGRSR